MKCQGVKRIIAEMNPHDPREQWEREHVRWLAAAMIVILFLSLILALQDTP